MTAEPISCAFDRLYPNGAGFPEPHMLVDGRSVAQPGGEYGIDAVVELFPAHGYGQPFDPAIFVSRTADTDAMEPLYRDIAVKAASPVVLVRIARAVVFNSLVYTNVREPRIIYETQRWNDRAATMPPPIEAVQNPVRFDPTPFTDYLFLASAGSPNYGHVLVDDLPRLKAIDHLRQLWPSRLQGVIMTSFGEAIDQVRRDAVAMLCGPGVEVRFVEANISWLIPNLFYASPCSLHPTVKNPLAMNHLRSAALAALADSGGGRGRLFVDRLPPQSRRLVNGREVAAMLADRGYTQVYPEQMTIREQVSAFASADRVVGQMGAAMTNTLFCARQSDIVYLAPRGWVEPFYWDLTVTLDQRYRVLYGNTVTTDGAPPHLQDCEVDLDRLAHHLDG